MLKVGFMWMISITWVGFPIRIYKYNIMTVILFVREQGKSFSFSSRGIFVYPLKRESVIIVNK